MFLTIYLIKKMKKLIIITAIASLAIISCKKNYTCVCNTTSTVSGTTSSSSTTTILEKMSKNDAGNTCSNGNSSVASTAIISKTTCAIE